MAARVVMPMRITNVPPTRASASQSCSLVPSAVADLPRHDGDRGGHAALGHRDADGGRNTEGGRDPGHHLPGQAGLRQRLDLLPAAAEEEGVASLEADHDGGRPPVLDQQSGRSPPGGPAPPPGVSGSLPTSMTRADDGTRSRSAGLTRRSCRTTSARASSAAPAGSTAPGRPDRRRPGRRSRRRRPSAGRRSPRWRRRHSRGGARATAAPTASGSSPRRVMRITVCPSPLATSPSPAATRRRRRAVAASAPRRARRRRRPAPCNSHRARQHGALGPQGRGGSARGR